MPTRTLPLLKSGDAILGKKSGPPQAPPVTGFLFIGSDQSRADRLLSALQSPLRHLSDGNQAIAYLLGIGRYADRATYPLPQAILIDLEHPGTPAMDLLHRQLLPPAIKLIPMIVLKSTFTAAELQDAYAQGAVSCIEFPKNDEAARHVAAGLKRYWLSCNLPPAGRTSRKNDS